MASDTPGREQVDSINNNVNKAGLMTTMGSETPLMDLSGSTNSAAIYTLLIFLYILFCSLNILLIIAVIIKGGLKTGCNNWLIINIATWFLVQGLLFVGTTVSESLSVQTLQDQHDICGFITVIDQMVTCAVPIIVLILTIERFISIHTYAGHEPGFSKKVSFGFILIVNTCIIVFVLILSRGIGYGYEDHLQIPCYFHSPSYVYNTISVVSLLIIATLTSLLTLKWCEASLTDIGSIALPPIVANTLLVVVVLPYEAYGLILRVMHSEAAMDSDFTTLWYIRATSSILVPLTWLVVSPEYRCCCRATKQDEGIRLLETK